MKKRWRLILPAALALFLGGCADRGQEFHHKVMLHDVDAGGTHPAKCADEVSERVRAIAKKHDITYRTGRSIAWDEYLEGRFPSCASAGKEK